MKENNTNTQKELIINAALDVFSTSGYEGASMRTIAAKAGCSTTIVYKHFTDKLELFIEVFSLSVHEFENCIKNVKNITDNPLEQLYVFGTSVLRFALLEHRSKYVFLFNQHAQHFALIAEISNELTTALLNVFRFLQDIIDRCRKAGYKISSSNFVTAVMCWAFVDGLAHICAQDGVVSAIEKNLLLGEEDKHLSLFSKVDEMLLVFGSRIMTFSEEKKNAEI